MNDRHADRQLDQALAKAFACYVFFDARPGHVDLLAAPNAALCIWLQEAVASASELPLVVPLLP